MPRGGLDGAGADWQPVDAERPVVHTRRTGSEIAALDPQDVRGCNVRWLYGPELRQQWLDAMLQQVDRPGFCPRSTLVRFVAVQRPTWVREGGLLGTLPFSILLSWPGGRPACFCLRRRR